MWSAQWSVKHHWNTTLQVLRFLSRSSCPPPPSKVKIAWCAGQWSYAHYQWMAQTNRTDIFFFRAGCLFDNPTMSKRCITKASWDPLTGDLELISWHHISPRRLCFEHCGDIWARVRTERERYCANCHLQRGAYGFSPLSTPYKKVHREVFIYSRLFQLQLINFLGSRPIFYCAR